MNNSTPQLYLASTSPRRRDLLETLNLCFEVVPVDVDETPLADESPRQLVTRLAIAKAEAGSGEIVLGADTVVVLGKEILGKPSNADEAVGMLLSLSGKVHVVMTGVALKSPAGIEAIVSTTDVEFREIDRDEAIRYWHSGEPADKAGGYGIQGLGGLFVKRISGSYSGVMGLPIFETAELLKSTGIEALSE